MITGLLLLVSFLNWIFCWCGSLGCGRRWRSNHGWFMGFEGSYWRRLIVNSLFLFSPFAMLYSFVLFEIWTLVFLVACTWNCFFTSCFLKSLFVLRIISVFLWMNKFSSKSDWSNCFYCAYVLTWIDTCDWVHILTI